MDALDKFVFSKEAHPAFDIAIRMENYAGKPTNKLVRASSSGAKTLGAGKKSKAKGPAGRLDEGFKQLFDSTRSIPSMIYSARANPGTPKVRTFVIKESNIVRQINESFISRGKVKWIEPMGRRKNSSF